jgi:hypothetical protein
MRPLDPRPTVAHRRRMKESCPGCGHLFEEHHVSGLPAFVAGLLDQTWLAPCSYCGCPDFGEQFQETMP